MPAPDLALVRLTAADWREFLDVRLASLADAPGAFGSRHADWVDASEELTVRDDNALAITAYERAGFTDLGVPDDWPADEPLERRMRRSRNGARSTP